MDDIFKERNPLLQGERIEVRGFTLILSASSGQAQPFPLMGEGVVAIPCRKPLRRVRAR